MLNRLKVIRGQRVIVVNSLLFHWKWAGASNCHFAAAAEPSPLTRGCISKESKLFLTSTPATLAGEQTWAQFNFI